MIHTACLYGAEAIQAGKLRGHGYISMVGNTPKLVCYVFNTVNDDDDNHDDDVSCLLYHRTQCKKLVHLGRLCDASSA